jgi:hypothetical protein
VKQVRRRRMGSGYLDEIVLQALCDKD